MRHNGVHMIKIQLNEFSIIWMALFLLLLMLCWWRQYGPVAHWYPTTTLHGVTTQQISSSWKLFKNTSD